MEKLPILCVDDEYVNLELFQLAFNDDYEIFIAESAKAGLELIKKNNIKVIVTDFKMPEINGLEFIKLIKKEYSDRVCIMLTAFIEGKLSSIKEDNSLIFDYILKPWDYDEVKNILDKAFAKLY